jgi:hypothetical protein
MGRYDSYTGFHTMPKGVRNGRSVQFRDLTGLEVNGLRFIRFHDVLKEKSRWAIQCFCGAEFVAVGANVKKGNTKSCGCLNDARRRETWAQVLATCSCCGKEFKTIQCRVADGRRPCCSKVCSATHLKASGKLAGENNPAWVGGRRVHPQGYILVRHKGGYVLEHRLVMEQHIGRELAEDEHVHHKNKVKTDNRIENLQLVTPSEHRYLHPVTTWSRHGHTACIECGRTEASHVSRGRCTRCYDKARYRDKGSRGGRSRC